MFCSIGSNVAATQPRLPLQAQNVVSQRCPTEMQFYTPSSTNLFVRYLPREVDDNRLREIFSVYGEISSSMVMRDIHNGQSLGTAFVRYARHTDALRALCEAHGMPLGGKSVSVQWAKQQHDATPAGQDRLRMNKLFIRNVPLDVSEKCLVDLVNAYGTVKKVTLHNDTAPIMDINARRRIVFITFLEEGAAEAALRAVHNTSPFPQCNGVPLMCKLINDAIKSKKHRTRSDSTVSPAAEHAADTAASPVAAVAVEASESAVTDTADSVHNTPAAVPASLRFPQQTKAPRKLSISSLNTFGSSPFVSGTDESPSTTPGRAYGATQWDLTPAATTPVGAFCGPIPQRLGTQSSSSSSQRESASESSRTTRFCHNPYSMAGEKMFV